MSYGALAAKLGSPRAMRAVGHANGSNPISVVIPCHRVIGADGSLVKYGGGLRRKQWLLAHEGAIAMPAAHDDGEVR
jgi:methylated-DNA-[protein]-cysteine S-methyltransferase